MSVYSKCWQFSHDGTHVWISTVGSHAWINATRCQDDKNEVFVCLNTQDAALMESHGNFRAKLCLEVPMGQFPPSGKSRQSFFPEFIGDANVSAKQHECKLLCTALSCLRQGAVTCIIQQVRSWLLITVYGCDLHSGFVSAVAVNMVLFLWLSAQEPGI